jgi:hypothetical protein
VQKPEAHEKLDFRLHHGCVMASKNVSVAILKELGPREPGVQGSAEAGGP